ncbi:MAG: YIP1 family protein [Alphaproteobacteria bacterium]|nr:YIP1 family protein [Alphaproteobacteria bacterium]
MTPGQFIATSLRDPAGVARRLTSVALPNGILWQMAALVTILSVLVLELGLLLSPTEASMVAASPLTLCVILGSSLVMMVAAIFWTGRMIGGQGRFAAAILLIVWWQGMALVIQVVQTVALLLFPPLAGIVTLAGLAWLVFALLHLVNVLHGFDSLLKSLGTVVIGVLGISFGLALLLALIGVTLQGGTL